MGIATEFLQEISVYLIMNIVITIGLLSGLMGVIGSIILLIWTLKDKRDWEKRTKKFNNKWIIKEEKCPRCSCESSEKPDERLAGTHCDCPCHLL